MAYLPLDANAAQIRAVLLRANTRFAETEKPKHYSQHMVEARRLGVRYTSNVPKGVDKDRDGEVDSTRRSRR
ncbi:hypothetical protein [Rubritalea tangerina]|uniref:hypothetical protein n=1 Tax=Rubritalea tangerina TaxID=430798 RepID=UPI003609E896